MDDPIFKNSYDKYKIRVKRWEKDFIKKYKRIPSKYDIKEAPNEIRYSYKMYYQLKTTFLENTLSDVLSDDGFDVFETENSQTELESSSYDFSNIFLPSGKSLLAKDEEPEKIFLNNGPNYSNSCSSEQKNDVSNFESVMELDANKKAWSEASRSKSLNEIQAPKAKETTLPRLKSNLSTKLFKSSKSFSMRNPRKSLSRLSSSNMSSTSNLNIDQLGKMENIESLPDLETILNQKAKEQKSPVQNSLISKTSLTKSKDISVNVDKGWLDRCSEESGLNVSKPKILSQALPYSENKKFGISNINLPLNNLEIDFNETSQKLDTKEIGEKNSVSRNVYKFDNDSDEIISNSEEESTGKETYRHIAKRRRILRDIDRNKLNAENKNEKEFIKPSTEEIPECSASVNIELNQYEPKEDKSQNEIKQIENVTIIKKLRKGPTRKVKNKTRKKNISEKHSDESCEDKSFIESGKKSKRPKTIPKEKPTISSGRNKAKSRKKKSTNIDSDTEKNSEVNNTDEYQSFNLALEVDYMKSLPSANFEELKNVESVLKSYISNHNLPAISKSKEKSNGSKSVAQAKLEEKIRKGTLNENFVRIDINKKIFVRGKKSVNYSRYKKKLWKNKKEVYALSGPNMDMRGCDGGVLTCHKCGQPGHFQRQCKQKGDALLPLNVEEIDSSEFLTLEEAAEMAQNKAVSVHSRNLGKLPEATNYELSKTKTLDNVDENFEKIDENENEFDDDHFDDELLKIKYNSDSSNIKNSNSLYIGHKIPQDFLEKCGVLDNISADNDRIKPIYDTHDNGEVKEVTDEVLQTLRMFGHQNFRKGQDKAIMRILSGLSTLVTLSTGSGKSLCYQLPAYIYSRKKGCITLVISPLVSLMEDQVHDIPSFLRAYCLHTNQTPQQRLKIMDLISKGDIDILLVSPEAIVTGERSTGFGSLMGNLPPIAFACIDEAHCVSQWSHNFRPSYLMICKVLKKKLGVKTILGLTATATFPTKQSIIRHLDIRDGEHGIITDVPLPDNLVLSISVESNRDNSLIQILRSERFEPCQSIIIYCTRREECERIAAFIRTCIQNKPSKQNMKKRKRVNWNAEAYHAGLPASRRRVIQNAFMKNELRIVVATIAFGMGINKPDIRAVIHYNMPRNFESYVQEIGRAGRDGQPAHCHLFLDSKGQDHSELRKHIFGNSIDRHVIRKLLQKVFIPCSCNKNLKRKDFLECHTEEIKASQGLNWNEDFHSIKENLASNICEKKSMKRLCPGHEIGFSVEETVQNLDIPEENVSTLLCYLELDDRYNLNVMSNAYTKCKVLSYAGSKYLKNAAKNCPPLAMGIALQLKAGTFDEEKNIIEFSVIEIASIIGWNSGVVKHQLKSLEWTTVNGLPKRSAISVSFYDLGFRVKAPGDFSSEEIDEALDSLYQRSVLQEQTQLVQLQCVTDGLHSLSFKSCFPCCDKDYNIEFSNKLKVVIRNYFQNNSMKVELKKMTDNTSDSEIVNDVQSIINMYPDNNFTGRSIARLFYGIASPNFPAVIWSKCKYWRVHMKVDFNRLVKLANEVIVRMRM